MDYCCTCAAQNSRFIFGLSRDSYLLKARPGNKAFNTSVQTPKLARKVKTAKNILIPQTAKDKVNPRPKTSSAGAKMNSKLVASSETAAAPLSGGNVNFSPESAFHEGPLSWSNNDVIEQDVHTDFVPTSSSGNIYCLKFSLLLCMLFQGEMN